MTRARGFEATSRLRHGPRHRLRGRTSLDSRSDHRDDLIRDHIRRLMCPGLHDSPACGFELVVSASIACLVSLDLCPPPRCVCLRPSAMFRTAVPETTVDVDSDTLTREQDVGPTTQRRDWPTVHIEAKSSAVQLGADRELGRGVALMRRSHPPKRFCGRGRRGAEVGHRDTRVAAAAATWLFEGSGLSARTSGSSSGVR